MQKPDSLAACCVLLLDELYCDVSMHVQTIQRNGEYLQLDALV